MSEGRFLYGAVVAVAGVALFAFGTCDGRAQNELGTSPFRGIFVTPVAGLPFSAVVVQEMTRPLSGGVSFQRKTSALIARDTQGRIHNESRETLPINSSREPALLSVHVYDPITRTNTYMQPYTRVARQQILPNPPAEAPPLNWAQQQAQANVQDQNVRFEDLGGAVMEGMAVHGYRRTAILPSKMTGTGQPIAVTDEYWYSEDLRVNMQEKHSDPRIGELTATVTRLDRNEPPADLFDIPPTYKVVDVTPVQ